MKEEYKSIMKEKGKIKDNNQEILKLDWEAPKLFCLDKGKTEGGIGQATETFSYLTPDS